MVNNLFLTQMLNMAYKTVHATKLYVQQMVFLWKRDALAKVTVLAHSHLDPLITGSCNASDIGASFKEFVDKFWEPLSFLANNFVK